ncbi:rna polymerase iii transcription factor [Lichtheimia corymbifera JMRC:FSU:9682]|uniref:Rna polymerase iii transcription factor n=1 Tax=Lichtheimia corymbifera JMRC:FSU:9682 TaxID=1263082 RepID=A0A068S8W6_9FUNG|nr:rna polymerase iii transcription factor [Lichtheimia corymbifera JMRC:FSU:9682]
MGGVHKFTLSDRQFICVEYPGRVKNIDRAIETLGGSQAITAAVENPKNGIGLRLRPKDPFCHPISGEVRRIPGLLLKVTRRRRKGQPEDEGETKAEILGTVTRTCRFRALGDFQYLVPKDDRMRQTREAIMKGDVQKIRDFRPRTSAEEGPDLHSVPPPLFSTRDAPFNYGYKQASRVLQVRVRQPDGSYAVKLLHKASKTDAGRQIIRYNSPTVPSEPIISESSLRAQEKRVAKEIGKYFQERSMWTRAGLLHQFPMKDHKYIRIALNLHCYSFRNGPWKEVLIRLGEDPRKDPSSHIYQSISIRLHMKRPNQEDLHPENVHQAKIKVARTRPFGISVGSSELSEEDRQSHIFDGQRAPVDTSTFCLCDVTDPDLQNLIHSAAFRKPTCTEHSGFYYRCVIERIRQIMKRKLEQVIEFGKADPWENPEEGLDELIEKEKESTNQDEDEHAAEERDQAQAQISQWEDANDPETAKMFETLREAGALSALNTEDLNLEDLGLDELAGLGSFADVFGQDEGEDEEGEDEEDAEDKPLWQLDDLNDL